MCVTEPEMDNSTSQEAATTAPHVIMPTDDCYMTSSMTSEHRTSSDDNDNHTVATTTSKKSSRTKSQDLNATSNNNSSPTKTVKKSATKRTFTAADLLEIEDKELRKKLRNRQSALAARERKKARMLELEKKVAELQESYRLIEDENQFLRARLENVIKQCESMGVQITGLDQNQHPSDMFPIIDFNNPKYHTTSNSTTANSPATAASTTATTNDCSSKANSSSNSSKKIQVKLEPHHQSSSAPVSPKTTNEFPMAAPSSVGGRSNSSSCMKQVSIFDPCFNSNSSAHSNSDEPQFEYQQLCNNSANYHHNHHHQHFGGVDAKKKRLSAQHKSLSNHVIFGADENIATDHNQMHATAQHHNNSLPSIDVVLKSSKKLNNKYSSSPTSNDNNYQSNKMCTGDADENNSDLRLNWFQYNTNNTQRLRSQSDESPFCKQEDLLHHHENSNDKNNKNNLTLPILPNEILYTINSDCDIFDGINSPTSFFETVAIHSSVDDSPGSFSAVSPVVDSACGLPDLLSDTCKGLDNISNDSGQSSIDAWVLDNVPTSLYEF